VATSTHLGPDAPSNARVLAAAARVPHAHVRLWLVPGATHAQGFHVAGKEYVRRVIAFFRAALSSPSPAANRVRCAPHDVGGLPTPAGGVRGHRVGLRLPRLCGLCMHPATFASPCARGRAPSPSRVRCPARVVAIHTDMTVRTTEVWSTIFEFRARMIYLVRKGLRRLQEA
jgi:hypothetical protein